jgi:Holliday junction resolvasome RuvABC endonuclease subunit
MIVKICGIDPGLEHTGIAFLEGDTETKKVRLLPDIFGVLETRKWVDKTKTEAFTDRERADWLGQEIMRMVAEIEPAAMVVEDFVFMGKRGGAGSQMPMLVEHLRMTGRQMGYEVVIYANGDWKAKTLKCRTANKLQVEHYIKRQLPGIEKQLGKQPDHVWDAIGLAYCKWLDIIHDRGNTDGTAGSKRAGKTVGNSLGKRKMGHR